MQFLRLLLLRWLKVQPPGRPTEKSPAQLFGRPFAWSLLLRMAAMPSRVKRQFHFRLMLKEYLRA